MNKVVPGAIIACLLGAGVASPALAGQSYVVVDSNGVKVGELVGQPVNSVNGLVIAPLGSTGRTSARYFLRVSQDRIVSDQDYVYYSQENCQGQGFVLFNPDNEILPMSFQ